MRLSYQSVLKFQRCNLVMIIYYFINIIYNMDFFTNLANKAKEKVSEAGKNVAMAAHDASSNLSSGVKSVESSTGLTGGRRRRRSMRRRRRSYKGGMATPAGCGCGSAQGGGARRRKTRRHRRKSRAHKSRHHRSHKRKSHKRKSRRGGARRGGARRGGARRSHGGARRGGARR